MNDPLWFAPAVHFLNLLLAALTAGAMFGFWLSHNPAGLSPAVYVAQQQNGIRALNVKMPLLGGFTVLLTFGAAVLARGDGTRFGLLLAAGCCFLAAGLITRFLNQPINAIVMTWSPEAPPPNWDQLRDTWWRWHLVRTAGGIVGLSLLIVAR